MGVNWKAYGAYVMAIWPVCPGFAWQFNRTRDIAQGWINLYQMGWLFAVVMGAFTYVVLSFLFKDPAMSEARRYPWESYAVRQKIYWIMRQARQLSLKVLQREEADSEAGHSQSEKNSDKGNGTINSCMSIGMRTLQSSLIKLQGLIRYIH